jgi:RNA polymerase sigma-70 factor, ECF subfamily
MSKVHDRSGRRDERPARGSRPPAGEDEGQAGARTLSDDEICSALEAGEVWAAEVVYDRVEDAVDATLFRLLGPGDAEREDLAQQALERVIRTIVSGRYARGCSLRSWATLLTQHLAIDTMRSRARDRKVFDRHVGTQALELIADDHHAPERALETQRRFQRLMEALARLPSASAETVVLHDLLGHGLPEIARLTRVTVAAAQSRLVRGRRKVLRFLAAAERPSAAERSAAERSKIP